MDLADAKDTTVSMTVQKVRLAQMPHALRVAAHSLSTMLREGGVEPEPLGPSEGSFLCPFCAAEHPLLAQAFPGGDDPAAAVPVLRIHHQRYLADEDAGGGAVA